MTRGLVLSLDGDNIVWTGSNGTNADKSGIGLNAGLINGSTSSSGVPGPINQAIAFPASNDYLQVGRKTTVDDMTNGFTFACWMKTPMFSGIAYPYAKGSGGGLKQLRLSNGTPYRMTWYVDCATTDYQAQFGYLIETNKWFHFAVTWTGGTVSNSTIFYVNGMPRYPTSATPGAGAIVSDSGLNITLGGYAAGSEGTFAGGMDQIRIYTNVLTPDEIIALYTEGRAILAQTNGIGTQTLYPTNYVMFDGQIPGTNINISLLTNITIGYAESKLGAWSFSAASGSNLWTIDNLTTPLVFRNPISVNGTTYTQATQALAYASLAGNGSGWYVALPSSWGSATACFYWKTTSPYEAGKFGGHDIINFQANSQSSVIQWLWDQPPKWASHTVSNGVGYAGSRSLAWTDHWYFLVHCWDTNYGIAHSWVMTTDDWPIPSERWRVVNYSVAALPVGTNATAVAFMEDTHGLIDTGTNYWAGWCLYKGLASQLGLPMATNIFK